MFKFCSKLTVMGLLVVAFSCQSLYCRDPTASAPKYCLLHCRLTCEPSVWKKEIHNILINKNNILIISFFFLCNGALINASSSRCLSNCREYYKLVIARRTFSWLAFHIPLRSDLIWDMWRPKLRWILQHSSHSNIALFKDAQPGSGISYRIHGIHFNCSYKASHFFQRSLIIIIKKKNFSYVNKQLDIRWFFKEQ